MRAVLTALAAFGLTWGARLALTEGVAAKVAAVLPQLLVAFFAIRAALAFDAEDRPRRGWALIGVAALTMVGARLVTWAWPESAANEMVLMVSNLLFVLGVLVFFNIVRSNPLVRRMAPESKPIVWGAGLLAVGAATAGSWIMAARLVEVGWSGEVADWTRVAALFGLLCDAAVCVLSIQLVGYLRPMSGGAVARPYLLMAAAGMVFLGLDMLGFLVTDDFGYGDFGWVPQLIVLWAWAIYVAAATEQVFVLRETRRP